MKFLAIVVLMMGMALSRSEQGDKSMPSHSQRHFDLSDPELLHHAVQEFTQALRNKDLAVEQAYRTDTVLWYYKISSNPVGWIPPDSSLAYIGYLDSVVFDELSVDEENQRIFKIRFVDRKDPEKKHRYVFHINEEGKLSGICYIPPITSEYFMDADAEDFEWLSTKINIELDSNAIKRRNEEWMFSIADCRSMSTALDAWKENEPDAFFKTDLYASIPYRRGDVSIPFFLLPDKPQLSPNSR